MPHRFKHTLLQRQLRKYLKTEIQAEYLHLLKAIDQTYLDADEERLLLERSLELTSEEMLQRHQELSGTLNNLPNPCFRLNAQGMVMEYFGQHHPHSIWTQLQRGKFFYELFSESQAQFLQAAFNEAQQQQQTVRRELSTQYKGQEQFYDLSIVPLNRHNYLLLVIDTSQQRQRESEIEAQNRQLRSFHLVSELIMLSSSLAEAYQQPVNQLQELTGFKFIAIERFHPESQQSEFLASTHPGLIGQRWPPAQTPSGQELHSDQLFWTHEAMKQAFQLLPRLQNLQTFVCVPMKTATQTIGTLSLGSPEHLPVTESFQQWMLSLSNYLVLLLQRKEETMALQISKRKAEMASETKNRFLATMSHEFRTPLNAILGFSRVLLKHPQQPLERQQNFIGRIYQNGLHLLDLVNDILDISRIEAGKQEIFLQEIKLGPLLEQTLQGLEETFKNKRLRYRLQVPKDLHVFKTDPARLRQIVVNLLSNAIKFTPEEGQIDLLVLARGSEAVGIEVRDTGIGISGEDLEKIFESFYQVDSSARRSYEGTGLGLSICRSLCELLHYRMEVDSQLGKGSCFRIHFTQV